MLRTAAAITTILASSIAAADPPGMTPVTPPGMPPAITPEVAPEATSPGVPGYRGWTLGADAAAVGLLLVAIDHESEDLAKLAVATYFLGAPIVHVAKDRPGRALASVGLRVGLPILGAMIGEGMHEEPACDPYDPYDDVCESDGPSDEAILGVIAGLVAASAIDTIYLAKGEPAKPAPPWTPTVRSTSGGLAVGLSGRF